MRSYVQDGENLTIPAPSGGVESGDGVLVGSLFGVATGDADAEDPVVIRTAGVVTLSKVSAQAWTLGAPIYWDGDDATTDDDAGGNTRIGVAAEAADSPSDTGKVLLGQHA